MGFIPLRQNWGQILGSLNTSLSLLCMIFAEVAGKSFYSSGMRRSWLHMTSIENNKRYCFNVSETL